MPRRTESTETAVEGQSRTALVMPDDIRNDLLRAQKDSIQTPQQLPQVRIMAAGAGLYEFKDNNDTVRSFTGIILANHPRNVLWDKKFGDQQPTQVQAESDQANLPACSSVDGRFGRPRQGFEHIELQGPATGEELIPCSSCKYNQWGSGNLVVPTNNPKGKAVTNQRSVYVLVEGRQAPVELILSPTSITGFDEYLTSLTNAGIPAQAVVTEFKQEIKNKPGSQIRWGVATFSRVADLDQDTFNMVLAKRQEFMAVLSPSSQPTQEVQAQVTGDANEEVVVDADEIPF